jgi:uncharacterized protein YcgL (UPF0745 family)
MTELTNEHLESLDRIAVALETQGYYLQLIHKILKEELPNLRR